MSPDSAADQDWPAGYDEHRLAQARMGLRLTPAERLRWLEETMAALRRWQGRARDPATHSPPGSAPAP
jgi:hypothetical protein